jgi:hypothetical protein
MNAVSSEERSKITDLRALLAERFPASPSHLASETPVPEHQPGRLTLPTGIPAWDAVTDGLRLGEITELCGRFGGIGLLMDTLLSTCAAAGWLGAWVDAGDSLEACDWNPEALRRMVWVRCQDPLMAIKGADMLLRDGNLSWVVLDLQSAPPQAVRRISGQHWHRFHRLVEHHRNALLVLTSSPMVEGAKVRILSTAPWTLEAIARDRNSLRLETDIQVFVRGRMPALTSEPAGRFSLRKTA